MTLQAPDSSLPFDGYVPNFHGGKCRLLPHLPFNYNPNYKNKGITKVDVGDDTCEGWVQI
eukprot:CAMPEP_0174264944 /NCGR_PEP_ID=MMETSP0439-20130205/24606_1 /TAXON_ID=0 /ORGANISM="Stereomyxa ramosa, Strain Chinc5" /LENGTH=59 /DNA_ID=CAMNT_0015351121 /DNA_START=175 /DNA_END=351 /DNA_ORIENTATION=+